MTDKQLIKTTKEFTKGLLGKRQDKGMCYAVCAPLQSYLSFIGCETQMCEGEIQQDEGLWNHFWLQLSDGRILDPTASQFIAPDGTKLPDIYLGEKPEWYKTN